MMVLVIGYGGALLLFLSGVNNQRNFKLGDKKPRLQPHALNSCVANWMLSARSCQQQGSLLSFTDKI